MFFVFKWDQVETSQHLPIPDPDRRKLLFKRKSQLTQNRQLYIPTSMATYIKSFFKVNDRRIGSRFKIKNIILHNFLAGHTHLGCLISRHRSPKCMRFFGICLFSQNLVPTLSIIY